MTNRPRASLPQSTKGMPNHRVWLHDDIYFGQTQGISDQVHKRFGLVLQHLMAHGRTGVVKGCRGANRGWRRSPLGGTHGKQYYLWWAPQGSPPCAEIPFPPDGRHIVIRDVRHHDIHDSLDTGEVNKSLHPFSPQELKRDLQGAEEHAGEPLNEEQQNCIANRNPVRLLQGDPGSGKTTALWNAVETWPNDRVLFLTWSTELARQARERFDTFFFSNVQVDARNFSATLNEIGRANFRKPLDKESFAQFDAEIARLSPRLLGPWTRRRYALYAEIRAMLLGRAIPERHACQACSRHLQRLRDQEYFQLRGGPDGIGRTAAAALLRVARALSDAAWENVFPDLAAASIALAKLRQNDIPDQWTDLDHIVVDEVQDLTLLEVAVVMELRRAIVRRRTGRRRQRKPSLLVAGDEGQTVRPSGFQWDEIGTLVNAYLRTRSKTFPLLHNLRCPRQIADVIARASDWYGKMDRNYRPGKQYQTAADEALNAQTYYVEVSQQRDASGLLGALSAMENLQIISLTREAHDWIPASDRGLALSPEATKGLEYQHVCILNPGSFLHQLETDIQVDSDAPELILHACRTDIDRLRVALSRATETLTFVDFAPSAEQRQLSQTLLDHVAAFTPDEWIEILRTDDTPVDQKAWDRVHQARTLIDDEPEGAWLRARQAIDLLGDPDLPNGVQDEVTRREAQDTALEIAARFLVDHFPAVVIREEVKRTIQKILPTPEYCQSAEAFSHLRVWSEDKDQPPFALLNAALALPADAPLVKSLPHATQRFLRLIEEYATSAREAGRFSDDVSGWLRLIGFTGHVEDKAWSLRCLAMDTSLRDGHAETADKILHTVKRADWRRKAHFHEARGHWRHAVELFKCVGSEKDALRVRKKIAQKLCEAGLACLNAKQAAQALEHFSQAIEWNPRHAESFFQRGQIFAGLPDGSDKLYDMAIQDLSKAYRLRRNVDALIFREMAYRRLGQFDKAQADLSRIARLDPERARVSYRAGIAYAGINPKGALRRDSPALTLAPHLLDAYVEQAHAFHQEERKKAKRARKAPSAAALRSDRNEQ